MITKTCYRLTNHMVIPMDNLYTSTSSAVQPFFKEKDKVVPLAECQSISFSGYRIRVFRNNPITSVRFSLWQAAPQGVCHGSQHQESPAQSLLQPPAHQELAMEIFLGFLKQEHFVNVRSLKNYSIMSILILGERGLQLFF